MFEERCLNLVLKLSTLSITKSLNLPLIEFKKYYIKRYLLLRKLVPTYTKYLHSYYLSLLRKNNSSAAHRK